MQSAMEAQYKSIILELKNLRNLDIWKYHKGHSYRQFKWNGSKGHQSWRRSGTMSQGNCMAIWWTLASSGKLRAWESVVKAERANVKAFEFCLCFWDGKESNLCEEDFSFMWENICCGPIFGVKTLRVNIFMAVIHSFTVLTKYLLWSDLFLMLT